MAKMRERPIFPTLEMLRKERASGFETSLLAGWLVLPGIATIQALGSADSAESHSLMHQVQGALSVPALVLLKAAMLLFLGIQSLGWAAVFVKFVHEGTAISRVIAAVGFSFYTACWLQMSGGNRDSELSWLIFFVILNAGAVVALRKFDWDDWAPKDLLLGGAVLSISYAIMITALFLFPSPR